MSRLRKTPPPRRALIVEAVRLGVDTAERLADLFGCAPRRIRSELNDLERRRRVRRSPRVGQGRRGRPAQIWRAS